MKGFIQQLIEMDAKTRSQTLRRSFGSLVEEWGVVVFLLQMVLLEAAGALITVLAAILAGVFVYIFLLMALRVIGEAELSGMPLGFFFILLGKNLGIL